MDLDAVKAALAEINDTELAALIAATNGAPPVAWTVARMLDPESEGLWTLT